VVLRVVTSANCCCLAPVHHSARRIMVSSKPMIAPSLVPVSPTIPFTSPLGNPPRPTIRRRSPCTNIRVFGCVWQSAALLHVVCAVYCGGIAYSYCITTPDSPLAIMLRFYRLDIAMAGYRHVAVTYGAMSIIHVALLSSAQSDLVDGASQKLGERPFRVPERSMKLRQSRSSPRRKPGEGDAGKHSNVYLVGTASWT
jgi:hypothetical protein